MNEMKRKKIDHVTRIDVSLRKLANDANCNGRDHMDALTGVLAARIFERDVNLYGYYSDNSRLQVNVLRAVANKLETLCGDGKDKQP